MAVLGGGGRDSMSGSLEADHRPFNLGRSMQNLFHSQHVILLERAYTNMARAHVVEIGVWSAAVSYPLSVKVTF